jgi:RNA polymerase sigma-70 factor (ECF subfamily)
VNKPTPYSPAVFGDTLNQYRHRLYQYLRRRLANEADAQELAQETFLRLLRVGRADLVLDPQAYLYRIARNLVYEQSCKTLPAESWSDESELASLADPQSSPEAEADREALSERIDSILAELPPRNRSIVLLFCREGLSQREIGERLGLSKSMVQKCLAQGIAHCRKRLRGVQNRKGAGR